MNGHSASTLPGYEVRSQVASRSCLKLLPETRSRGRSALATYLRCAAGLAREVGAQRGFLQQANLVQDYFNTFESDLPEGAKTGNTPVTHAYIDTSGGTPNLWSQSLDGGPPKKLTDFKENGVWRYAWSRDGKQLALTRGTFTSDVVLIRDFR